MVTFHELYERYAGDVHRFAVYLSGDRALADDITSETFLRAWNASGRVREATVKAYLFAIARNVYVDETRRRRRHAPLSPALRSPAPGPDERARHACALDAVLAALRRLPDVDRAALLLRLQEGFSYAEIARALKLTVSAAKVKVHRARMKLAEWVPKEAM